MGDDLAAAPGWRSDLVAYRALLASRMRAQRSYRLSFGLDLLSSGLVGVVELAEVWVIFHSVTSLGGFRFTEMLLVFGLADCCFSIADMLVGHCDNLPPLLRAGTIDVFYLRPLPVLMQLITSEISLRRLARAGVGVVALVAGLAVNDVDWRPAAVVMLALALVSGTLIFSAMFVWAGGLQFYLINGAEMTNAFVYGGRYAATQPPSVWGRPLLALFGFAFPMVFTGFVPMLVLLDRPGPSYLPAWLAWWLPVAAAWAWSAALLTWRAGVRHYEGAAGERDRRDPGSDP